MKTLEEAHGVRWLRFILRKVPEFVTGPMVNVLTNCIGRTKSDLIEAPVNGFRMLLDPTEIVDARLLLAPERYDQAEMKALRSHLSEGDVFVDVGAYTGFYALQAAGIVGTDGKVVAIEPEPRNYSLLRENVSLNESRSVSVIQAAVSNIEEERKLHVDESGNRGASSLIWEKDYSVKVVCKPLQDILHDKDLNQVSAMKLDTEGFELKILRSFFAEASHDLQPDLLIVEDLHIEVPRLLNVVEENGYSCVATTYFNRIFTKEDQKVRIA